MIKRFIDQKLLLPFGFAVLGVVILVMLGNWQMQRKAWKAELIEMVTARVDSAPVTFDVVKSRALAGDDIRYQPVEVTGSFVHDAERHYFLSLGSKVGWHILTPLKTTSGDVVFIDRGFVPDKQKVQSTRMEGLPQGKVTVTGLARRFGSRNRFTPDNSVSRNKWYWRDGPGLYKSLSFEVQPPLDFMIDTKMRAVPAGASSDDGIKSAAVGKYPLPGVTRVSFTEKHFGYALTWYGLALTLIGVFGAFAYGRLRGSDL